MAFDLFRELTSLLSALDEEGINYALCGGLAMAVQAGDLWVASREGMIALKELRGSKQDLADIEHLSGNNDG